MTSSRRFHPWAASLYFLLTLVTVAPADDGVLTFPRIVPVPPAVAAKSFEVLDGFRMDLLAAEPLVTSPVALEYDEHGQGWVLEMRDYPFTDKNTDKPFADKSGDMPMGRIRVLRDTDGDGVFDKSQVFTEEISWPTGLAFWKGGVFVTATPDIWYFKDTDGDGVADVREKVFTGFRKFNIQAVINNLKWGLDHQIYGAGGTNGGSIKSLKHPQLPAVPFATNDFRIDPATTKLEAISGGARFGLTFDDWGNRFLCNIRNPVIHVLLPAHYLARNPAVPFQKATVDAADAGDTLPVYRSSPPEAWRTLRAQRWSGNLEGLSYPKSELVPDGFFTSACGVTIYRGTAYPKDFYGQAFLADVASNLIHREAMTPTGVTFRARRIDEKTEFVRSKDVWFRPVNFVNAPDGTLHVVDMYRETIEHPWSIPDDIKAALDLESGRDLGRLWRLTPPNFKPVKFKSLATASTAELVAELENRNVWHRETAHRLLFERQDKSAVEPLRKLLNTSPEPLARLHALWSLKGLWELTDDDVLVGLSDPVGGVREHAVRLAEGRLGLQPKFLQRVLELADDVEPRVRFQVAFSLGGVAADGVGEALVRIAQKDAGDEYIRAAVLSSSARRGAWMLAALVDDPTFAKKPEVRPLLRLLAQSVGAGKSDDDLKTVGAVLLASPTTAETRPWKTEVISGLGEGLKRGGKTLAAVFAMIDPRVNLLTTDLLQDAVRAVTNPELDVAERIQAAQMLGFGEFALVNEALFLSLDPRQPSALQQAAIKTLAIYPDLEVARKLLAGWNTFSPPVRTEVVEAMLARADWIPLLLDSVQQEKIGIGQITPVRRGLLMKHADPAIRERAKVLFARESPGPRGEVIKDYEQKLLTIKGDLSRGLKIFERECATCHRIGDKGQDVGPNLETIRHHAPQQILTNILDPSREVSPAFVEYVVTTLEGRVATGMMASETATSVTLRRANNVQETILRANIDEIVGSGKSLMPEGLEKKVTPQEIADLLTFILNRPTDQKSAAVGGQPQTPGPTAKGTK
ncbi:MAG: PVC-type heme-binding CxxCH protein [Planctomycetota bacterium]